MSSLGGPTYKKKKKKINIIIPSRIQTWDQSDHFHNLNLGHSGLRPLGHHGQSLAQILFISFFIPGLSQCRLTSSSSSSNLPSMVIAYDVIIRSCVARYLELSFSIDAEVFRQANKEIKLTSCDVILIKFSFLFLAIYHLKSNLFLSGIKSNFLQFPK